MNFNNKFSDVTHDSKISMTSEELLREEARVYVKNSFDPAALHALVTSTTISKESISRQRKKNEKFSETKAGRKWK